MAPTAGKQPFVGDRKTVAEIALQLPYLLRKQGSEINAVIHAVNPAPTFRNAARA
jgi:hypothetical protein